MSEELEPLKMRTIAVDNKAQAVERLKKSVENVVQISNTWLEGKRAELNRASIAHQELVKAKVHATKLRYSRNRVQMLTKVVNALEAGFVPIPRFTSNRVNLDFEDLPLKALVAFNDAKATGLFDEVRIVRGKPSEVPRQGPDPLLIGIIRMRGEYMSKYRGNYQTRWREMPPRSEHFLLAWWRPEDEIDSDMW